MKHEKSADPNGVCGMFERISWSLIEEPEICELCRYFEENGNTCTRQEEE